jgi:hypothetical protein
MEALFEHCPVMANRLSISRHTDRTKGTAICVIYSTGDNTTWRRSHQRVIPDPISAIVVFENKHETFSCFVMSVLKHTSVHCWSPQRVKTPSVKQSGFCERGGSSQTSWVYMALNGVLSRCFWSVGRGDAHGATELTSRHARDCDFVNPRAPCVVLCASRRRRDRKYNVGKC